MGIFKSKEERELIKKEKQEDKALMKEIDQEIKEQSRKDYEKFIDEMLLEDNKEEEYLESIMTDEEKKEMIGNKKQEAIIGIVAVVVFTSVVVIASILIFAADYKSKSDLVKESVPILKDYYKKKYGRDLEYLNIDYLCKENDKGEDECSKIGHLVTTNNEHLMIINNDHIGDDISTGKALNDYNEDMRQNLASLDLVSNYPILSYKDYYLDYNIHYDYIHVLPSNTSYERLKDSKKLTVTEFIFYNGEMDKELVKRYLQNFSEDSVFYMVKNVRGIPSNLTIMRQDGDEDFKITAMLDFDGGTYYELDRSKNTVTNVTVNKVNGEDVEVDGDYKFTNCYKIVLDEDAPWDKKDELPSYFFIKLNNITFNEKNIYEFSVSGYRDEYQEQEENEYSQVITYTNGNDTYVIGNETIGIGNISVEDSVLCKIGLC